MATKNVMLRLSKRRYCSSKIDYSSRERCFDRLSMTFFIFIVCVVCYKLSSASATTKSSGVVIFRLR